MQVGEKFKAYWCVRDWDNVTLWRAYEVQIIIRNNSQTNKIYINFFVLFIKRNNLF